MPIYEFKCNNCGNNFEELVWSSSNKDLISCPKCGCLAKMMIAQLFNYAMAMKWAEDRREHFQREFEKRKVERPRDFG